MAVIILRGTNGSGKTHIVSNIIKELGPDGKTVGFSTGQPGRIAGECWERPKVLVLGKYATACGGCDGFSWKGAADDMERVIQWAHGAGYHTLLEGLTVSSWGQERLKRLQAYDLHIVQLNTPLNACLKAVEARRAARAAAAGKELKPLDPTNCVRKYESLQQALKTQPAAGILVSEQSREEAAAYIRQVLGM